MLVLPVLCHTASSLLAAEQQADSLFQAWPTCVLVPQLGLTHRALCGQPT